MKLLKKLTALALSATLLLSAMAPALASEGETTTSETFEGTIWISNPQQGATYHAYKLLDLYPLRGTEPQEGDTQSQIYGFQADSPWAKFFLDETTTGEGETATTVNNAPMANYFDVVKVEGDDGYMVQEGEYWKVDYVVTLKSTLPEGVTADDVGANIAQAALAWVDAHTKDETNPVIAAGTLENASDMNNGIEVTERGYYLVDTNSGSLGSLGTIGGDHGTNGSMEETTLTVDEKNMQPTLVKHVWDQNTAPGDGDLFAYIGKQSTSELEDLKRMIVQNNMLNVGVPGSWYRSTSADFYDTVYYRMYVNASKGAERYWIFDRLDPSLTLDTTSFRVYKYSYDSTAGTGTSTPLTEADWTLETGPMEYVEAIPTAESTNTYSHKCSFILKFSDELVGNLKTGEYLVVFYNATLNEQAVAEANANTAVLGSGKGNLQYTDITDFTINETGLKDYFAFDNVPDATGKKPTGDGVVLFGTPSNALVYSYYFDLVKTDKDAVVLDGAKFELQDANGNPLPLVEYDDIFPEDGISRKVFDYQYTTLGSNLAILHMNDSMLEEQTGTGRSRMIGGGLATANLNMAKLTQQWKYYGRTTYSIAAKDPGTGETITTTYTFQQRDHHYRLATAAEIEAGKDITEFEAGHIRFVGLDAGIYYLNETVAPEGYNKLAKPQKIELSVESGIKDTDVGSEMRGLQISGGLTAGTKAPGAAVLLINDSTTPAGVRGDVVLREADAKRHYEEKTKAYTYSDTIYGDSGGSGSTSGKNPSQIGYGTQILGLNDIDNGGVQIVNLTGTELPHTGGMGTTLLYTVGGVLVAGAGILLITKKRMSHESDEG